MLWVLKFRIPPDVDVVRVDGADTFTETKLTFEAAGTHYVWIIGSMIKRMTATYAASTPTAARRAILSESLARRLAVPFTEADALIVAVKV